MLGSNMAKPDIKVNFRVPETLKDELEAFAAEYNLSLSEACRVLLNTALVRGPNRAAAEEMVYAFGVAKARIAKRVLDRTGAIMAEAITAELGGA